MTENSTNKKIWTSGLNEKPVKLAPITHFGEAQILDILTNNIKPEAFSVVGINQLAITFPKGTQGSYEHSETEKLFKKNQINFDQIEPMADQASKITIKDFQSIIKLAVLGFQFRGSQALSQQDARLRMEQGTGEKLNP